EELHPERNLNIHPLFQVVFGFENTPMSALELPGLVPSFMDIDFKTTRFDLELHLWKCSEDFRSLWGGKWENSEGIRGVVVYNTDLFDEATITRMLGHFKTLLQGIVNNSEERIANLPLLGEAERQQLLIQGNDTQADYPKNKCIHQLFENQVEQNPDSIAVIFENVETRVIASLTYRELDTRSNQLAHYLQKLGVGSEVLVGICMERSVDLIVGLLGILKAGGAYVPLDPSYPQERLKFMLDDACRSEAFVKKNLGADPEITGTNTSPILLLTQEKIVENFGDFPNPVVYLDKDWEIIAQESKENPNSSVNSDNLAYVIYTSGSTGKPKGVAVTHKAVNRLVCNTNYIKLSPDDKVAQASNTSFDAATFEIWGALLNGAQLVGISRDVTLSPHEFALQLQEKDISILFLTTALFQQIARDVPQAFASLRYLLFGGEAVDIRWVKKVLQKGAPKHLIHVYGPTESTTFSSYYCVENLAESATSIPIGRPITNTQIYLLDAHLQPVPIGVVGELYIGGDGLAREYLNRPELTAERFISNPFVAVCGSMQYGLTSPPTPPLRGEGSKTPPSHRFAEASYVGKGAGGLGSVFDPTENRYSNKPEARLYKTGDLARYLPDGNIEFLGRIDNQVKIRGFRIELGEIEAAVNQHPAVRETVVIVREDIPGDKHLVAYIVPNPKQAPASINLRQFLKEKLPEYMVPSAYVMLESLPLTPNGKVDRRGLPAVDTLSFDIKEDYVAPRDRVEEALAEIWAKVLGKEQVGVHDNFFELGGHSLLATQLTSRIRDAFQIELSVRNLFESPTVASLARHIETMCWAAKGLDTASSKGNEREEMEF
ncbi:MAG: amino acid adenylation domain-containing protein, partial [Cyanobacteriota bacterium]